LVDAGGASFAALLRSMYVERFSTADVGRRFSGAATVFAGTPEGVPYTSRSNVETQF